MEDHATIEEVDHGHPCQCHYRSVRKGFRTLAWDRDCWWIACCLEEAFDILQETPEYRAEMVEFFFS